jgi:hypothetical protein
MTWSRLLTHVCVCLACIGLLLPGPVFAEVLPGPASAFTIPAVTDVQLDPQGSLRGMVLNPQGIPLAKIPLVLRRGPEEVARTSTDPLGRFSVAGLRGGTYQLVAGGYAKLFRVWTARSAPPQAKQAALLVVGDDVLRGQQPLGEFLCSDCVLCTALVAAAIAIPIAVYNSGHGPASP